MAKNTVRYPWLTSLSCLNPVFWWPKLELDPRTILMMMKGALAPTITIAIYQSDAISNITSTIGYLSALISVLSQGLMPRGKFIKIMVFNLLATCVSASLCCLAIFCAVKAREHNIPTGASESVRNGFSSDACAVAAIWLIFMIWAANSLRAWKPMELQDPMVAFSIFASVTITRGGMFTSVPEGLEFISRLLKGFMIGFAIATAVSLLIFPITCRGNVFHDIRDYIATIQDMLPSQISVESDTVTKLLTEKGSPSQTQTTQTALDTQSESESTAQKTLQASMAKLNRLHSKLHADLPYSRDEIAWGKLTADDLRVITYQIRTLLLPLSGMSPVPELLSKTRKKGGPHSTSTEKGALTQSAIQSAVEKHATRLADASDLVCTGLRHFLLALELIPPKLFDRREGRPGGVDARDEEARGPALCPQQPDFGARFELALHEFYSRRKQLAEMPVSLEAFSGMSEGTSGPDTVGKDPDVRQEFFVVLYMAHLWDDLLDATLRLVRFADEKVATGAMKRNRLIFPRQKSIREWFSLGGKKFDAESRHSHVDPDLGHRNHAPTELPDPEHLPPANVWEKGSSFLRVISHAIKSDESTFGFRVAAAAFSVGILAFMHQTQDFFIRQRCIWAMIVIVIGMNPTSGQTMFGFVARICATAVSLVLSLVVWYIVDGKTAGVIVFLYLANILEYYFYIKVPQYFGASVISIVTLNVIIGYELQVRKLGIASAESNGQPYYPIYLFGPYKLAAVAAGCAISFFWVIFPYPITAKSQLRKVLGRSLFVLAKLYSCMHTTIELWLGNELGHIEDKTSTGYQLQSARHGIFKEEMMLLSTLRTHSHFSTFEPPIGGKFPKRIYDDIIAGIQGMLTSMSLMAYTAQSLNTLPSKSQEEAPGMDVRNEWMKQLAEIASESSEFNSHRITALLCHLSASISNAQPLPPSLTSPESFPLAKRMQRVDTELLSIRHVGDPAFSAFVSLEVLRSVVGVGLRDLLDNVRKLVGELSFDFHVSHSQGESSGLLEREE